MDTSSLLQNCLLSNFYNLIRVQLDDTNYVSWRFMLESMLIGCDLIGYIDGSIPCPPQYKITEVGSITSELTQEFKDWRKNDSAVIALLAATLSSNALSFIIGSKSSKEVWCLLEERYAKLSKLKAFELQNSMQKIQKGNDSIDKYMERFKTIRDNLSLAGVYISDEDMVDLILNGLPVGFLTIKIVIRASKAPVTLNQLRTLLLDFECDINQESSSFASAPMTTSIVTHENQSPDEYVLPPTILSNNSGFVESPAIHASNANQSTFTANLAVSNCEYTQFPARKFVGSFTPSSGVMNQNGGLSNDFGTNSGSSLSQRVNSLQSRGEEFVMTVPNNKVALIIGKGGTTIKSMQTKSGSRIQIIPLHLPLGDMSTTRSVYISGGKEQIAAAKELINKVISGKCLFDASRTNGYMQQQSYHNDKVTKGGYNSNSNCVYFPGNICQICSQSGHFADACPQRSAPRQVIGFGSHMQCQICMKTGHSAAECLHRHNHTFQQPTHILGASQTLPLHVDTPIPVPTTLSQWQQQLLKQIEKFPIQGTWQLLSTSSDPITLYCRQNSYPLQLCQSLPLVDPG